MKVVGDEPEPFPVRDPDVPYDEHELAGLRGNYEVLDEQIQIAVREFREHHGWTKQKLAEELHALGAEKMDPVTLLRIEQGTRAVKAKELWVLAAALRVQVEDLYGNVPATWTLDERITNVEAHIRWLKAQEVQLIETSKRHNQEAAEEQRLLTRLKQQRAREAGDKS